MTALRRPFLYFPLEGHFERQIHVANRLERHGAQRLSDIAKTLIDGPTADVHPDS